MSYFTTSIVKDVVVIKFLFSELALHDADEFKQMLYGLAAGKEKKFVINMSNCVFISSIALGVLVFFTARIHEKGGKIAFSALTKEVRTIFSVTKLEKIFDVYNSDEEALKALE